MITVEMVRHPCRSIRRGDDRVQPVLRHDQIDALLASKLLDLFQGLKIYRICERTFLFRLREQILTEVLQFFIGYPRKPRGIPGELEEDYNIARS